MPCIGLAYIAAALEQHGCHVRVIDMFAERLDIREVVDKAARFGPICWDDRIDAFRSGLQCDQSAVRVRTPEARIVWGGVHADVFASEIVRSRDADFAVHHDGEITVCELVDALASNETDFSAIDGLTWMSDDGPVTNKARAINQDFDSLPYPAWHLFPYHKYGLLPFADFAKPVLTISGSRGCPYRCDYCSLIHTGGKGVPSS